MNRMNSRIDSGHDDSTINIIVAIIIIIIDSARRRQTCRRVAPFMTRHQTWNWVTGSPGQWVIWVIFHVRVTGSSFWPDVRPEFSRFSKKCPKCKTYSWNAEMTKVIVRRLWLNWNHWMSVYAMNVYFYLWLLKILWPENTSSWHKSTCGVHYRTGSMG